MNVMYYQPMVVNVMYTTYGSECDVLPTYGSECDVLPTYGSECDVPMVVNVMYLW